MRYVPEDKGNGPDGAVPAVVNEGYACNNHRERQTSNILAREGGKCEQGIRNVSYYYAVQLRKYQYHARRMQEPCALGAGFFTTGTPKN
jgi:hypothetical protein